MSDHFENKKSVREATLEAIFASITDSLLVLDADLTVVEANDHQLGTLGMRRDEVVGRAWLDVFPHLADTGRDVNLREVLKDGQPHRGRIPLVDMQTGVARLYDVATYPVCDELGRVTHLVEYSREVTEEVRAQLEIVDYNRTLIDIKEQLEVKTAEADRANAMLAEKIASLEELNKRLERMAVIDVMTDLPNHRAFQERLAYEVKKAQRHGRTFSLILIDVDNFKQYNDRFGHPAGDVLLTQLARLMRECVREVDLPARYGGEEFAILLPETDKYGGAVVAERLRAKVAEFPFQYRRVTVSIGVAEFPADAPDAGILVTCADQAMYYAKKHGKDSVCLWQSQLDLHTDHAAWPVEDEGAAEPMHNNIPDSARNGLRVLLVEQNPTTVAVISRALADLGHHVTAVDSPHEALASAAHTTNDFDVILAETPLDPHAGGDFRNEARAVCPLTPVIFLSSQADHGMVRRVDCELYRAHSDYSDFTSLDAILRHTVAQSYRNASRARIDALRPAA